MARTKQTKVSFPRRSIHCKPTCPCCSILTRRKTCHLFLCTQRKPRPEGWVMRPATKAAVRSGPEKPTVKAKSKIAIPLWKFSCNAIAMCKSNVFVVDTLTLVRSHGSGLLKSCYFSQEEPGLAQLLFVKSRSTKNQFIFCFQRSPSTSWYAINKSDLFEQLNSQMTINSA